MKFKIGKIHIFALAAHGQGISGSDRIFIETSRILSRDFKVKIYVWGEGFRMCQRHGLDKENIEFKVVNISPWDKFGFLGAYLYLIIKSIFIGLSLRIENPKQTVIYSASDFWMDVFPAFIIKNRFKQVRWIGTWFQTAPNPLKGFNEGGREEKYRFKALLYWLSQLPVKHLIQNYANLILVNNQSEISRFNKLKGQKFMVFLGALDLEKIEEFKQMYKHIKKKYQAVFQGRFHPQKGVVELVDIWRRVVDKKPSARLAMIGDGPLMGDVKNRIKEKNLGKNIDLFGYLFDGPIKYKIFSQSQVVIHPAFYDSGGMAAAEAMAFGLPCVGFDLDSYKSYYPKGMIKVDIGNLEEFANIVISLLNDQLMRNRIGAAGLEMIKKNWSWDKRGEEIFNEINR